MAAVPGGDALGFNGWSGGVSPNGDVTFTFNEASINCSATCTGDIVLYSSYNTGAQLNYTTSFIGVDPTVLGPAAVPEPSSILLWLTGMVAVGLAIGKKRLRES